MLVFMLSFDRFKHKAGILRTTGFALLTPFGLNMLNCLTGIHYNDNLLMIWLSVILIPPGYLLVERSQGLMEEVDATLDGMGN